ncbi:MAG: T9SS type A sorting domain-containing protein [Bacteroidetes bacterium]|nr:T9SS type A sorting domain-containing protein [Bacteroidota bacterium]
MKPLIRRVTGLIIFVIMPLMILHAQTWQWAQHIGSVNHDGGGVMCLDGTDNLYIAGYYFFPYGVFGADTIATYGNQDIFITKADPLGNFLWTKRLGSDGYMDGANDMLFEPTTNSIIITGKMDGSNGVVVNCGMGNGDKVFLSKLDIDGNCMWSKGTALQGHSNSISICHDDIGNIFMTGNTTSLSFFNEISVQPGGFIAKFRSYDGSLVWVRRVLELPGYLNQIRYFNNTLYIGGVSVKDTLVIDNFIVKCNKQDPFISKFDTTGKIIWVKTMGGKGDDIGGTIGIDGSGNIYTTGTFQDTAYFDNIRLTNGNKIDWYIAKYNTKGTALWARQANITGTTAYHGVNSVNTEGQIYAVGTFSGNASFGDHTVIANSPNDMFLTRYSSDGICMGVANIPNTFHRSVINDHNGNAYVTGSMQGSVNFGHTTLSSYGSFDVCIAKHDALTAIPDPHDQPQHKLVINANPTTGKCTITIPEEFINEKYLTLQVFDSQGKLIQQAPVEKVDGKIKLNIEAQARGTYTALLGNGTKSYTGKIIFR